MTWPPARLTTSGCRWRARSPARRWPGLKETVLLHSTKESQLVDGMLANLSGESIIKEFKPSGVNYKLAVRLTGKFKTAFPDGKPEDKKDEKQMPRRRMARSRKRKRRMTRSRKPRATTRWCSSATRTCFTTSSRMREFDSPFGQLRSPCNANLNLAQNLVEQMTGDSNLIAVRSRATLSRPFTRVQAMQAEAEQKFQAEIKRLEDSCQRGTAQDQRIAGTEEGQGPALHPFARAADGVGEACARRRLTRGSASSRCRRICARRSSRCRRNSSGSTSWPCRWR